MKIFSVTVNRKRWAFAAVFACLFCSCATKPVVIPETLTSAEIIQRAQEASDRGHYRVSIQYYEALLERNPANSTLLCTAGYEIAYIHYKERKYNLAKEGMRELLGRYEGPDGEPLPDSEALPQEYQILARIMLKRIEEKQQKDVLTLFGKKKKDA